jgi:hypothetical protein
MDLNRLLIHFLIPSSILFTMYPMIYLMYCDSRLTREEQESVTISITQLMVWGPILFGVLFVVLYETMTRIPIQIGATTHVRFIVVGALTVGIISLLMDALHVYEQYAHIEHSTRWVHVWVILFYIVLFSTIGVFLSRHLLPPSRPPLFSPSVPAAPTVSSPPRARAPPVVSLP